MRVLAIVLCLVLIRPVLAAEEIVTLDTRPGVTTTILVIRPPSPPAASLLLYTGGGGAIGLNRDWPKGRRGGNFLIRSADLFVQAGFQVAIVDNPSDSLKAIWNRRDSRDHARDAAAIIAYLRAQAPVPVWVAGTSMGSVSAAAIAARLGREDGPDGVVLTSSVTGLSRNTTESVLTVDLGAIRVPVLVVNHADDACFAAPPDAAERILDALDNAPRRVRLIFHGGKPPESDSCEPFAPHGYFGIEAEVVTAIADWIKTRP